MRKNQETPLIANGVLTWPSQNEFTPFTHCSWAYSLHIPINIDLNHNPDYMTIFMVSV